MTVDQEHKSTLFDSRDWLALNKVWTQLSAWGVDTATLSLLQTRTANALDLSVDRRLSEWRSMVDDLGKLEFATEGQQSLRLKTSLELCGTWGDQDAAEEVLQRLHPWRKGPIRLGEILIDTEWRSDWKWERVHPHLGSLKGKRILDVGCGNGYHCWRAFGEEAEAVIGIDPTRLFHYQFRALEYLIHRYTLSSSDLAPVYHLPLTLEALDDASLPYFDLIMSMGVLYHRRDPAAHLKSLQRHFTHEGGRLLLETLITPATRPLYPEGRYAQMRNVWCLPDIDTLCSWLVAAGYDDIKVVDINQTSLDEQRPTPWMRFYSLTHALDPSNPNLTIEGHPAPLRAAVMATYSG